jgi:photosystem II stability/assembly factor-like uncharacterized protein
LIAIVNARLARLRSASQAGAFGMCSETLRRTSLILSLSLISALTSCKGLKKADRGSSLNKAARWVAQYRATLSLSNKYAGTNLVFFSYNSICVASSDTVFVAADMPNPKNERERIAVVVRTTDGGSSWTELPIEQAGIKVTTLNAVSFVSRTLGWAAGADSSGTAVVAKTSDGGNSWLVAKLNSHQTPTSIFFVDENTGWMGGVTQRPDREDEEGGPSDILATTDGGRTWMAQYRVPVSITDIHFTDKKNGWAVGFQGAIYHTSDGGQSWNRQRSELEPSGILKPAGEEFTLRGIHFIDPQRGWAVARSELEDAGRVLATTNGGKTWSRVFASNEKFQDVFFVSTDEGWIAAGTRYIYHTTDGGHQWQAEPISFEQNMPIYRLGGADPSHIWAVGGGAIFHRVTD